MRSASGSAARTAQAAVITGSVVDDQPQRCPTGVRVDHDTALGDAHGRHDRFGEGIHQRLAAGRVDHGRHAHRKSAAAGRSARQVRYAAIVGGAHGKGHIAAATAARVGG